MMVKPEDLDPSQLPRELMVALATSLDNALARYDADHEALATFFNTWTVAGLAAKSTGRDQYEFPFVVANALMLLKASQLLPSIAQMVGHGLNPTALMEELQRTKVALDCEPATAPSDAAKRLMRDLETARATMNRYNVVIDSIRTTVETLATPGLPTATAVRKLRDAYDDLVASQGRVAKEVDAIAGVLGSYRQLGKKTLPQAIAELVAYVGRLEDRVTELSEDDDDTDLAEEFYDDEDEVIGEHVVPGEPGPRAFVVAKPGMLLQAIGGVTEPPRGPSPLKGAEVTLSRYGAMDAARMIAARNPDYTVIEADFVVGEDGVLRCVRQAEARVYRTIQGGHGGPLPYIAGYERVDQTNQPPEREEPC